MLKKIFILANTLLFIATVLSYLAPYINPIKAWIFPFFATAYFWLLLCNLLFILVWVLAKNKLWLLSLLAILLGIQHVGSYLGMSMDTSTGEDLLVMTYNLGTQSLPSNEQKKEAYRKEFFSFITEQGQKKPDILCLQESMALNFYQKNLNYKYSKKEGRQVILTDYEIIKEGIINFPNSSNNLIWVDLNYKGSIIRVVNVHLQSNKISEQAEDLVQNADLIEKKTWLNAKSVISKIKHATKQRTVQTLNVKKFIATSPYPTILVGDFNDTPLSYTYRQISHNLQDAFCQKGQGLGITYAGIIPGLRIDYVLASDALKFTSYDSPKVDFSDHYPILCHFQLKDKQ